MTSFIKCSEVEVRDRQRSSIDGGFLGELKASILSKGLLHAPVIARDEKGIYLIAGFTRKSAMEALHAEGRTFYHNGAIVALGEMPCVWLDLAADLLLEAELEENITRRELSWQDRTKAIAAIHALRKAANPSQTLKDTAGELISKAGQEQTPGLVNHQATAVRNATLLAAHMHRPSIANSRNATEALGKLLKEEEAKYEAEIIKRRRAALPAEASRLIEVRNGDFTQILPGLADSLFDLIIADLPYGISANTAGHRSRTVEHHNYDDSPERAATLLRSILTDGFRVAKPRANAFIFGDVDLFPLFKQVAGAMGWTPFRTPIVWRKSETEGLAPWGAQGPRRTYELIFFATKGKKGLLQSPVDILDEKRVGRSVRRYGPEKPVGLLKQLIECASMPGDYILDPCCGAGPTLIAARHLGRKALGIELDEAAYHLSVVAAERDPVEPKEGEATEPSPPLEDLA